MRDITFIIFGLAPPGAPPVPPPFLGPGFPVEEDVWFPPSTKAQPLVEQRQVAAGGTRVTGSASSRNAGNQSQSESTSELAESGLGFESPFEDELDTPAFLRKPSGGAKKSRSDRDVPAFMRRGRSD